MLYTSVTITGTNFTTRADRAVQRSNRH